MTNDVTFERSDFVQAQGKWSLVDDVCDGEEAIKEAGDKYLPRPNPSDESAENKERYEQYKKRAVFYGATGRTLQGLVGAAFRKDPTPVLPSALEYALNDVDGAGVSIFQQSQEALNKVLKRGRHILLVDFPRTEQQASRADMASGGIRSTIVSIDAQQVRNWRVEQVGADFKLTLLVIFESVEEVTPDGFGVKAIDQYRVLRLKDGYTQEIWRKEKDGWVIHESFSISDGAGNRWDEIPVTFVGANNNDHRIDPSPMYDLAVINVAHYRNSADYEDSAYFCGQAQPWMAGLSEEWRNWMQEQGIYVGSRSPILLPEGGEFGIAQAEPNTLAKEAMDQKEAQMKALGARLLQPGTAVKTATEAQGDQESEHSVLSLAAQNVSSAYTKCLGWMARFMNTADDAEYTVQQDFVEMSLDAQMLTALVGAWQSGNLPQSDLWTQLRKHGLVDSEKTDEQIKEELDAEDSGLNLDGDS